jgi:hypothetical protein
MVRFFRNIFLITLPSLVILFLILEVFFRFVLPATDRPQACFDTAERIFKHCPDAGEGVATFGKYARQRGHWRINNHGWNSPIDYNKHKDRPRIAVIGDSYVEAFQVDVDKAYPSLMRAEIGDRYDVYSFGISGASLSEYLNISRYVNRNFDPDILIFNIRYNDFAESVFEINRGDTHMLMISVSDTSVTETIPRPNHSFSQFSLKRRLLLKSALVRYLTFNLKIRQVVRDMFHHREYSGNVAIRSVEEHRDLIETAATYVFERLSEENRGKRVIIVMAAPRQDIYDGTLAQSRVLFLNELVQRLSSAHGFELLDLTEPMLEDYRINHIPFNSPLDAHWNAYGHAFVARQVLSLGFQ